MYGMSLFYLDLCKHNFGLLISDYLNNHSLASHIQQLIIFNNDLVDKINVMD